jgi:putative membrane protein
VQFGPGPFGGNGPFAAFVLLVLFVIVIAALALLITLFIRRSRFAHRFAGAPGAAGATYWRPAPASDALRILDERFARGEIDADDYKQRRDLLNGQS